MMRSFFLSVALSVTALDASAQSAIEHHVWQDARTFAAFSRTAVAITGSIALSGNPEFASEGSTMRISFENGTSVGLTSEGASWRSWDMLSSDKQTAEVFRLSEDPGELQNGNTLCGGGDPELDIYAVFFENSMFDGDQSLNLAVFQSVDPPVDINSPGLCGTYSYEIGEQADL